MATNSDREIDWEIARLSGGLSAARRAIPAHHGSLQPSDWDLAEREGGPLSERGEALAQDLAAIEARKRPIIESIAPMSMEAAAPAASEPPPAPAAPGERNRPNKLENAFWTGAAAAMSLLALGLVAALGIAPAPPAATPARVPAPVAASRAVVDEGVPFAQRPMVTLDPVLVAADPPRGAEPVAAARPARTTLAAVTPSPAAIAPRMVIPSPAGLVATTSPQISRPAAAVAISVAGRRAASCLAAGDARSTMPVSVTFAPSGRVTTATVDGGPFVGTTVGGCIAGALRSASVAPFDGAPVTVHSSVRVR